MSELLSGLQNALPYLQGAAWVIGVALALIAAAAAVYTVKTAFGPLLVILRWMFAHTPGEKPNDIVAGISFGGRMLAWAALVGLLVWLLIQWRAAS